MARRKKKSSDSGVDIGMVMVCSLFLIILTFFILLNSIAVIDDKKARVAIGSLVGSFGSLKGGLSPLKTGESIMPPTTPLVKQGLDFNKLISALDTETISQLAVKTVTAGGVITISEALLFEKDSHRLKPGRHPVLDGICRFAALGGYPIEIMAYTDSRPAEEKGYRSNWELTSLMAVAVLQYMVEKGEIAPERMSAVGREDQKTVVSNESAASRRQNRRIEIVVKYRMPPYAERLFRSKPAGIFTYKRFDFKVF